MLAGGPWWWAGLCCETRWAAGAAAALASRLEATCDVASGVGWEPAVVVWCPVAKGQQLLVKVPPPAHLVKEAPTCIDQDPSKLQPYLIGMWRDVWVDPNAWVVGPLPVSHFLVKPVGEGCCWI